MKPILRRIFPLALLVLLPACRLSEDVVKFFNLHVGPVFGVRLEYLVAPSPAPAAPDEAPKDLEAHHRLNAAFLKEAHMVVLERTVTQEEFARWLNVLDQGGSYEGIYNGLANGEEYRAKEKDVAPPQALRLYAQLMTELALAQRYEAAKPEKPAIPPITGAPPPDQPPEAERKRLLADYAVKGVNKSLYTLKREVGQEALKTADLKKEYKERFATWYGRFAVVTNRLGVDFGIPDRNAADEVVHYRWALNHGEDPVKWEVLNRIHRVFNNSR